ncbi:curlin [Pararhodobacter marinus]|uniref:Curlin n=2 Tax=Pararhodobacter marinus TaxID=2184063 RepID=A0A2U2CE48_9RHOB|nr:curlin [Pararhodobacter marinus]PWE30064.1 curlin [Pararhodobacter marinus]
MIAFPKAALLAAALAMPASLPLASPAEASGGISINIAPSNAREARLLRLGLAAYALHQDIETNGHVTQQGAHNAAGIAQGATDQAIIHQDGTGHTGTVSQTGGHNAYGLFQFGQNTTSHVSQTGGQTGLTVQFGW